MVTGEEPTSVTIHSVIKENDRDLKGHFALWLEFKNLLLYKNKTSIFI